MHERKALIRELIASLGEDVNREGLLDTPRRVDEAYNHLFGGYQQDPHDFVTVFDGENYDEMILVKDVEFFSTCEHHMLPFFGKAHVAYIPNGKILGLSKIPRLIEVFSRRLQNQERITMQVADILQEVLQPKGVAVVLEAKHFCMMARGVQKQLSVVSTSALRGFFKTNAATRAEFLRLIRSES